MCVVTWGHAKIQARPTRISSGCRIYKGCDNHGYIALGVLSGACFPSSTLSLPEPKHLKPKPLRSRNTPKVPPNPPMSSLIRKSLHPLTLNPDHANHSPEGAKASGYRPPVATPAEDEHFVAGLKDFRVQGFGV